MAIEHLHHLVVGAGPVARAVVDALAERDIKPTVATRSGTEIPGAMAVAADVNDRTAAAAVEYDVVYQCAQPPYHRWPTSSHRYSYRQSAR